jgi:purine-cytosine permease-like protein
MGYIAAWAGIACAFWVGIGSIWFGKSNIDEYRRQHIHFKHPFDLWVGVMFILVGVVFLCVVGIFIQDAINQ